ncbi:SDR family oxidoreductase [Sphingopyxis sp. 113P3]|jgi:Short-chain alcohol dehydrogenase of unknown specificity|uniref:SDR family oxidoreductase n=1 Tax=Sphingopyxis sp. (strain 113P3) TaxID=292913 RepID=UPI0006AD4C9E|nr:SDR family oxidoreductase [Sphingopyxis sp. 113P3]ALC14167.1 hypothetical protein LH20_19580 [Sphingopyxis sp. 113P3]
MPALHGKVVAITGGSSGIGRAIARELARCGTKLVLNALADEELDGIRAEFSDEVVIVPGDVAERATGERLLANALDRFGRIDVLVNNAGIFRHGPVASVDLDELDRMIAINFGAVVRNSYLFSRAMIGQGDGHIINISSISSTLTTAGCGAYGGTKRAVEAFSDALRIELAGTGVRVGIVAPGTTDTYLFDRMPGQGRAASANAAVRKLDPTDLAEAVRFMLERPEHANLAHLRLYSADQRH